MITTILQKCIDELSKDKESVRDISYVRGMLETLLAMQPATFPVPPEKKGVAPETKDPIESLDLQARNAIEEVKKLAGESAE